MVAGEGMRRRRGELLVLRRLLSAVKEVVTKVVGVRTGRW
jgi:hypothetical protein